MTEILELVNPALLVDEKHDDNTCFFCKATAPPRPEENNFTEDPDGDEDAEAESLTFKNDSGKLTENCGGNPGQRVVHVGILSLESSTAAHHLIPGNASLKKSKLFKSKKYLWTDGKVNGNIGYDINSSPNGEFLPGNYAQRPWGSGGKTFEGNACVSPKDYAFACIEKWGAQFHDAHPDYSKKVKEALDLLYKKLEAGKDIWCPDGKQREDVPPEERTPMYAIVNRLHTLSGRMRRMLVNPNRETWKRDVYTSRFSKQYIDEKVF